MSAAAPPWSLDVAEAARQIRARALTPSALLASVLERVDQAEPLIHSLVLVDREGARQQAEALDAELAQGRVRGPLHGIPIAIKDLFDVRGLPTRAGSRAYHDAPPAAEDSTVVARLRAAGAVIYAKAVTHELAIGDTTPGVANPWDLARTAGGSSGGSAAAVAAGIAPAALGSDTGGSIRNPAAFTGLVGLKPTYGRVSRAGGVVLAWSLDHVGPLARTVDDAALVLGAIAGPDPRDPSASARPLGDLLRDPGADLRSRRLGVPRELFFDGIDRHVQAAFDHSRASFEALGASVLDVSIPELEGGLYLAEMIVAFVEAAAYHRRRLAERGALIGAEDRLWLEIGALLPGTAFVKAQRIRARLQRGFARAFREQGLDALLVPGTPAPSARFDHLVYDYGDRQEALADAVVRTACPFNLAGLPVLALPVTLSPDGLPIGIQLAGRPWAEETVLALGRAFERRVRFRAQHPEPLGLAAALGAVGG